MGVPFSSSKRTDVRPVGPGSSVSSSTASVRSSLDENEEKSGTDGENEELSGTDDENEEVSGTKGGKRETKRVKAVEEKLTSASEEIVEKAEEFWREIRDLQVPNPTEGRTIEQIIDDIADHEWKNYGIDWDKGAEDDDDKLYEVKLACKDLKRIQKKMSLKEVAAAKSMGLLDKNGKVPKYDLHSTKNDSIELVKVHGDAVPFVIWGWKPAEAAKFRNATNDLVKSNICNLIRNFQMMTNDSPRMLVKVLMEAGIWGLGLDGLNAVRNVLATLPGVTKATEAYAILEGIVAVGENVVKLAIRTATLGILAPLFASRNYNAAAIMIIINETSEDLRLEDIYLSFGNAVGVFNEQATVRNPQRVIPKVLPPIVNKKTGNVLVDGSIQAGFFVARKKDKSMKGSTGVLMFEASKLFPDGVMAAWTVPYAYSNNRIRMGADSDEGYISFCVETESSQYDDSQDSTFVSSTGAKVTGRVNSKTGGEAYYIIRFAGPPKDAIVSDAQQDGNKDAEKRKKLLNDIEIPDVTKGKITEELIEDILDHEKEHHGIDWRAAMKEGPRSMGNAVLKAHGRLHKMRKAMNQHEVDSLKSMGLLDAKGNVKELDLLGGEAGVEANLAPIPSGAGTFPCWAWTREKAAEFQNAKGDRIKDLISNLIRNFQVMEKSDENMLAHFFMKCGLIGIGVAGAQAVWKVMKTIEKVADGIVALADGIITVGLKVIQFAISVFVLAILVPIFILAMKDAAQVMVIINDTDDAMSLQDLATTHGKIVGIFKDNTNQSIALPIIPKRKSAVYNEKGIMISSGAVFAGFFAARKNDNAVVGSQGAMKFSATTLFPKGVSIGWEIPLSIGSNRLLVSADFDGTASAFSDKTNEEDKQEDSSTSSKKGVVVGRVNSGSGSRAYYIMSISAPKVEALREPPTESIEEKADKLWAEIKDLKSPNVTQGKTTNEVIADIIAHEKIHYGIDWEAAAKGGPEKMKEAMEKAHQRLDSIRSKMSDKEVERAKQMGLLGNTGEVPCYDILGEGKLGTAPIPSGAAPYTIWGWKEEHAAQFQNTTGERIKDLIVNLVRNFQVMGEDDERMMVKAFMDAGMWAVGGYGLIQVVKILKTLYKLTQATEAYAVFTGIMEVGVNVIKIGIATVIIAILVPLFIYMNKDAAAIFVIVNDTDSDLDLLEYHTTHGKIVGIFKENPDLDNPKPIIPKRLPPIINPKTGKEVCKGSIQAGFFAARKNDNALVGSQGALKFGPMTSFPKGVFMGWEVPLSQGSNRLLVSTDFNGSTSEFSDKTNDGDKQEDTAMGSNGAKVVSRVHSASGSEGYYVFNVTESKKSNPPENDSVTATNEVIKEADNKSDEELISQILNHEKKVNGIDWREAAKAGKPAIHEAIKKARAHLKSIADKMTKEERHHALEMGLINEKGDVPEFDLLQEQEDPAGNETIAMALAQPPAAVSIPSTAAPYMVWGWKPSVADQYENAQGNDIKTRILTLIRDFQAMKKDNKEEMVNGFMQAGLWGVGLTGLRATWRAMQAASAITEAVEAEAIAEGIAIIGVNVVTMAIAACILAVLVPIFIFMSKNAAGIMVIINDTDEDMIMVDLHATHGKIVGIFKEKASVDNPQPILPKRLSPIVNPTTKKVMVEGAVTAGFFAAQKRDNALYGSQGGMQFGATERYPQGISLGWEVPLTMSSNRLLVSARFNGSASEFSNETNSHGVQTDTSQSTKGAVVAGRVNSGSGSEAYYIFSIK